MKLYTDKFSRIRRAVITDCSFIKNVYGVDCVGPSPVDRGRRATKVSVISDEYGVVISASFHKGNKHDSKAFLHTFTQSKITQCYATRKAFYADRAYDTSRCDNTMAAAVVENRCARRKVSSSPFPPTRAVVEHVFSWLDKFRRIILRL